MKSFLLIPWFLLSISPLTGIAAGPTIGGDIPTPRGNVEQPIVTTIAGNGELGTRNGPASQATFIEPYGVAVGPDGTVFVTDMGANEIRSIHNGVVGLVAGLSRPGMNALVREGGYRDGPALSAEFSRPTGIAVGKDGVLYVADSVNRCIRKIQNGQVTTFAGAPGLGGKDGPAGTGGFLNPRSVSINGDGELFVADFGIGIRKISLNGTIGTVWSTDKSVYSVSARGSGGGQTYAVSATSGMYLLNAANQVLGSARPDTVREPNSQEFTMGHAFAIALAGDSSVLVTDILRPAIRYVELEKFRIRVTLAGDAPASDVGSFADGVPDVARVDSPLGIAAGPNGNFVFTDAGNRRIREITNLSLKSADGPASFSSREFSKNSYKIAIVGNSYMYHGVLWSQSIPGQLEKTLNDRRLTLGKRPNVDVRAIRINASGLGAEREFIDTYLADGQADLVLLLYNGIANEYDLLNRASTLSDGRWKTLIPKELRSLEATLQRHGTKLVITYVPIGKLLSDYEQLYRTAPLNGGPVDEELQPRAEIEELATEDIFLQSGVPAISLFAPMRRQEMLPDRIDLFNTIDEHPSAAGAGWIGREIARRLLDQILKASDFERQ